MSANLTLSDAAGGDVVVISGREYRLMIQQRGGWLCRIDRDGGHHWFDSDHPVEAIAWEQPKRNPKARKGGKHADAAMGWQGTVR